MDNSLEVSVIICCHNSSERIEETLTHVFLQTKKPKEIIIVDNNCTDDTTQKALQFAEYNNRTITIVDESQPGLMHARIAGIKAATGNLICFVDDDNWLEHDYLHQAELIFQDNTSVGYAGGKTKLPIHYVNLPEWLEKLQSSYAVGSQYNAEGILPKETPLLWGAGLIVRAHPLKMVINNGNRFLLMGRQGKSQLAGDDSEICFLLAMYGWSGFYSEKLCLTHAISEERFTKNRIELMFFGFGAAAPTLNSYWVMLNSGSEKNIKSLLKCIILGQYQLMKGYYLWKYLIQRLRVIKGKSQYNLCMLYYYKGALDRLNNNQANVLVDKKSFTGNM